MIVQTAVHRVGHQHGVINRGHVDAKLGKYLHVVLHVLTNFDDRWIGQHWGQHAQCVFKRHLPWCQCIIREQIVTASHFMGQGNVACLACLNAKRDANKVDNHLIQTRGFGVYSNMTASVNAIDPCLQLRGVFDLFVFRMIEPNGL